MKELFDKSFWRRVVKTYVEAREGVHRPVEGGQSPPGGNTPDAPVADQRRVHGRDQAQDSDDVALGNK